jgi:hypothetical protein
VQVKRNRKLQKIKSVAIDRFFEDEPLLWEGLKHTRYYHELKLAASGKAALGAVSWLRVMTQVPSTLSLAELVRIFDEEDTMSVLSTVRMHLGSNARLACMLTCLWGFSLRQNR